MINKTITVWHRDGLFYRGTKEEPEKEVMGQVYRNGELLNTDGKWEHLVITYEEE